MTSPGEKSLLLPSVSVQRARPANLDAKDDELFREAYSYRTCDAFLKYVGSARVSADSIVYKNYSPLVDTLYQTDHLNYYRVKYLAKKLFAGRKVGLDRTKNYLIATDQESSGHFHWLTEVIPRLWLVREEASEFSLMLPDTPYIRSAGIASLEVVGLKFKEILWMKANEFYKVPNLYLVSKISGTGQMHDGIMRELNRAFTAGRPTGRKKFYIGRERAQFRKVLNRRALIERLKRFDFEVVHPADLSFRDQVNAFSECGVLIGIHGAGLTNCMFMPAGGKVVELRKREPNYAYWHLAESVGHEYYYYHGVPDSDLSLIGRGCNLTITLDDFEQNILNVI